MSSKRSTNRTPGEPVQTNNIAVPEAANMSTDIPQPEITDGVRLNSRASKASGATGVPAKGVRASGPAPDSVLNRKTVPLPGDLEKITRNDVELFFEASHAFRTNLAKVLPEIAVKIGKFVTATPYTLIDASGRAVQMIPDVHAMTPAQAKLAGLVLNRLLPPLTDMDIEGRMAPGKGTHVDARQVRITVNTIGGNPTTMDERLANAGGGDLHPNAAVRVAPITMNLGEIVKQAQDMMPSPDGEQINPDTIEAGAGEEDTEVTVDQTSDSTQESE